MIGGRLLVVMAVSVLIAGCSKEQAAPAFNADPAKPAPQVAVQTNQPVPAPAPVAEPTPVPSTEAAPLPGAAQVASQVANPVQGGLVEEDPDRPIVPTGPDSPNVKSDPKGDPYDIGVARDIPKDGEEKKVWYLFEGIHDPEVIKAVNNSLRVDGVKSTIVIQNAFLVKYNSSYTSDAKLLDLIKTVRPKAYIPNEDQLKQARAPVAKTISESDKGAPATGDGGRAPTPIPTNP